MAAFSRSAAEQRLGPAAVAAIKKSVAEAPLLRTEQREQLRAVFATARPREATALAVPDQRAA